MKALCFPRASSWSRTFFPAALLAMLAAPLGWSATVPVAAETAAYTDRFCSSCHNDVDKEGGLDLTNLSFAPNDSANFLTWVKVHDRVQAGEMPPREKKRPDTAATASFVKNLSSALTTAEQQVVAAKGRAVRRRMNRTEYENALRDLLQAPWLLVKEQLPEDGEAFKFNKVSTALDISYVHMTRYMQAADYAMRQALVVKFIQPETKVTRFYARDNRDEANFRRNGGDRSKFPVVGSKAQPEYLQTPAPRGGAQAGAGARGRGNRPPLVRTADPEIREQEATGWVSSTYVTGFRSDWSYFFRAPVTGRYKFRFNAYTIWVGPGVATNEIIPESGYTDNGQAGLWFRPNAANISAGRRYEPITLYAFGGKSSRKLGGFDLTPEPSVQQVDDVWLASNEFVATDASRFFKSRPTGFKGGFTNPLAQRDGMPAVAFRWMEVEGPLYDEATAAGYRTLFGDLPLVKAEPDSGGVDIEVWGGKTATVTRLSEGDELATAVVEVVPRHRDQDAERLLRAFMARAYRGPVDEARVKLVLDVIHRQFKAGQGFASAMLAGYTAVLSSPQFVFIDEQPGRLSDMALATRLALFLWNSTPDEALLARVARGELRRPEVLRAETERMLDDAKSQRFVNAFLDYWLDLRRIEETTPSTSLYNDYYLDDSLLEAALDEPRMFFRDLVQRNLPARNIVDSDFTYLNDRLAIHYGMPEIKGVTMRRVSLPAGSVRGGFMTQAATLKVNANGTTTSPVLRGKWIMERIVGHETPPPPAAVPAVEPDIRGATTIRAQLDKHRADESCAVCHRKIDPPGFALENFDVMGGWRTRYRATAENAEPVPGFGKNGWPYAFYLALPVDAGGTLADGASFADVRDFKRLLLRDEAQLARNLAQQLSVFATGAPVRFSDRAQIERILEKSRASQFGVRTLVHELIQSELFLNK